MKQTKAPAKEKTWIKIIRILIYAVSIVGVLLGASLIKTGGMSGALADGTFAAKIQNGKLIFFTFLIILSINILWGILRWFLRMEARGGYGFWQVIGKLVGGGIWRAALIMPLGLFALFFVAPKISGIISENVINEKEEPITFSENYERLKNLKNNYQNLSVSEIQEELDTLFLNNVDFDTDASGNVSKAEGFGFFERAYAYSSKVTTLNKAKLSSGGKFVIFYTDMGDDKISDEKAGELAEMMEEIVAGYEKNLGFSYSYEKLNNNLLSISKIKKVLQAAGIKEDILETAMPVYVVNPYKNGSSTLATYAGRRFLDLGASLLLDLGVIIGEETSKLYNSTPSYPFVNILPGNVESESLAIVAAHELGHHYAANYNYENYGKTGSDDNFIDETAPNWMAINVLENQPEENLINKSHYNGVYLKKATGMTIAEAMPDFDGYPAVAFLENYYEIVPGAKEKIMDAVYYGGALEYLYEQAGEENFRKVMVSLAERNLTGDYGGKLTNMVLPKGEDVNCKDVCTKNYTILPAATEYLYFAAEEYKDTVLKLHGEGGVRMSVLGRKMNGEFKVFKSGLQELEFEIAEEFYKEYEMVVVAVANTGILKTEDYELTIVAKELEEIVATEGEFNFENFYTDLGEGCYEIDTDSLFDNLMGIVDLGAELVELIEPEVKGAYEAETAEARGAISEAKEQLAAYRISVCGNYIKDGVSFEEAKARIQKTLGFNLNIYDEREADFRMSVFLGFDLLARTGRVFVLAEAEGEMGMLSVNVAER